jgi:hypothetical protein
MVVPGLGVESHCWGSDYNGLDERRMYVPKQRLNLSYMAAGHPYSFEQVASGTMKVPIH